MDLEVILADAAESGFCHLSYLGLSRIPPQVFTLTNLVRLDIGHNDIREIPADVRHLTKLEQLWANDNPIVTLPPEISECISLKRICLQRTDLYKLPYELCSLSCLVFVDVMDTPLKGGQADAYRQGGTIGILSYLAAKYARKGMKASLATTLQYDVYTEEGGSEGVAEALAIISKRVCAEFADDDELRSVIRNAARLFPPKISDINIAHVRERFDALKRDNLRKQLSADLELKLRALYYDRIDVTAVEGIVSSIATHVATLDDMAFLLQHVKELLPPNAADISGREVMIALNALRTRLAEERQAAVDALLRVMMSLYPEANEESVKTTAALIAAKVEKTADIRSLAADASEVFPPDFSMVKPAPLVRAFRTLQKDKGLT